MLPIVYAGVLMLAHLCIASGNPYPIPNAGLNATKTLYLVDKSTLSHDMQVATASVAGLLARDRPRVFLLNTQTVESFTTVLATGLQTLYNLTLNSSFIDGAHWSDFLSLWAPEIDGFVLADSGTTSVNAAASLCAASPKRLVIGTPSTQHYFAVAGIPLAVDATSMTPADVLRDPTTAEALSRNVTVLQAPAKAPFVTDYAVFARALHWWETDYETGVAAKVYGGMLMPTGVTLGWGASEFGLVRQASRAGTSVVASDWALNLATLSGFGLPPQTPPGQKSDPASEPLGAVHTLAFSFTDGDNVQWLLSDTGFSTSRWFGSPARGSVPLGWTIAPAITNLAPTALNHFYSTASAAPPVCRLRPGAAQSDASDPCPDGGADDFVCAVSGAGYMYPDAFAETAAPAFAAATADGMAQAGLRVANVLMDGVGDWERDLAPIAAAPGVDGLLVYQGDCYRGPGGRIAFVGGKPAIGARFSLWSPQASNVTELARQVLAMPRDPTSPTGYSLVPVHAWSHDTEDVLAVVTAIAEALKAESAGAGGIDVVTPAELMRRVARHVSPSSV